jgi:hypothetical protein
MSHGGRHRLVTTLARIALIPCLALVGGFRGASPAPAAERASDASFWPADPTAVAIVAKDRRVAITDGHSIVELWRKKRHQSFVHAAGADGLLAFAVWSFSSTDELIVVDLVSGQVARTDCERCFGVAVVDRHVVTIRSLGDTGPFALEIHDPELRTRSTVPITPIAPPDNHSSSLPRLVVTAQGTAGSQVVVSTMWSHDGRRGPTAVTLHSLDGTPTRSWTVDGVAYTTAISADERYVALSVGGTSSSCLSTGVPVVLDTTSDDPIVLVPNRGVREDGATYRAWDLWWNGPDLEAGGGFLHQSSRGCTGDGYGLRRFTLAGGMTLNHIEFSEYRLLGPKCDRALATTRSDRGQGKRPRHHLFLIEEGTRRRLADGWYLLWRPPQTAPCSPLPGIPGT